jgi:hypothetical protein
MIRHCCAQAERQRFPAQSACCRNEERALAVEGKVFGKMNEKTVDGGVSRFSNKPLIHKAIIKNCIIIYRVDLLVISCISHRVIPDLSAMLATQGRFAFKRWQNTWSNAISPSQQSYGAYHVFAAQAVEPV